VAWGTRGVKVVRGKLRSNMVRSASEVKVGKFSQRGATVNRGFRIKCDTGLQIDGAKTSEVKDRELALQNTF
jgi:hypothetical protein